jgi:Xaa-Pro dipeptidase
LDVFEERCSKAQKLMTKNAIDYLFVGPGGADLGYICNYKIMPGERLRLFVLPAHGKASFITPAFEVPVFKLRGLNLFFDLVCWEETEDPMDHVSRLVGTRPATIAVDDKHWGMFITGYLRKLPKARFVSAEPVLGEMRLKKDATEIGYLKQMGEALDKVWEAALEFHYADRKESELAADLLEVKKKIFEPPLTLSPLGEHRPQSGLNSSSPHAGGPDRLIKPGDGFYWEIGRGACHGYIGDKTRSAQVSPASEEIRKVYEVVKKANETAFQAIRPGVTCESIDRAGREVIEKAGYGEFFTHRIGHGLGLDAHEPPYVVLGNKRKLEPGMVFSVEPGIYLPEKWGIRIENIVYVTEDGPESFYSSPAEFREVR